VQPLAEMNASVLAFGICIVPLWIHSPTDNDQQQSSQLRISHLSLWQLRSQQCKIVAARPPNATKRPRQ